ncbi:very short patch repair endonuclease [Labrys neptuniae]|uniref:Very short patch repair endonuclease n=1 Tax=Labrys neptuniae TaxID=376174 RepID=A0ABV3PWW3_9HYPH
MSRSRAVEKRQDAVAPATRQRMQCTAQRDNLYERALRAMLHRRGLRFRTHQRLIEGTRRTADLAFLGARVAVLIDGCFWHGCPMHGTWPKNNAAWWRTKIEANIARDRDTDMRLQRSGWQVIRVWEHEAIEAVAERIERIVHDRKSGHATNMAERR